MVQPSPNALIFMHSCTQKHKLGFLGLRYIWGNYSTPHETAYTLKNDNHMYTNSFHRLYFTKSCINAIEGGVLTCMEWAIRPNGTKNTNNGDLGLKKRKYHECLHSWKLGGGFGVKNMHQWSFTPAFLFMFSCTGCSPKRANSTFFLQEFFAKFWLSSGFALILF